MQALDGTDDAEVYREEMGLAVRAEDAGFDSIWFSEHHFSGYQVTPQTPMVLSWLAGQTKRVKLGQMVTVLPWHDPVRVAESYTVLDHLSGGRAIVGLGRGLGRIEFDNFRGAMGESRRRFAEYSEAILEALETGYIEHDGELYKQPRASDPARADQQLQGPHVRRGRLPGVDGAHGPHGGWDPGDRPEALGDDRGGVGPVP